MGGNRNLLFVGLKKRRYGRPTLSKGSKRSRQPANEDPIHQLEDADDDANVYVDIREDVCHNS
jgi:hypothetical protein